MHKLRVLLYILLFQLSSTVQAQDAFYRSYIPYDSQSVFSLFPQQEIKNSSEDKPNNNLNLDIHFINWTQLNYFCSLSQKSSLTKNDNFVLEPWLITEEQTKEIRALVYNDLLSIIINSDLTLKRLVFLNLDFHSLLFEQIYNTDFIHSVSSSYSKLMIYSLFHFIGENGLIDLFIKSKYAGQALDLKPVESPYIPNAYRSLVIEARGLGLKPALLPNIYSYDKEGNLILVYSFNYADKSAIIQNGYAHYVKSEEPLVQDKNNFYTSAMSIVGEARTDIVISRDSYLKFFGSEQSLEQLKRGNLNIVIG